MQSATYLENNSWWDHTIEAGEDFIDAIEAARDGSSAVVPVLTPISVGSAWVKREVEYAKQRAIPVMPLLLEPCDLGTLFHRVQVEDVSSGRMPSARFVEHLRARAASTPSQPGSPPSPTSVQKFRAELLALSEHPGIKDGVRAAARRDGQGPRRHPPATGRVGRGRHAYRPARRGCRHLVTSAAPRSCLVRRRDLRQDRRGVAVCVPGR
ncbi:toll/interleukin-1 receptor domain-containing protein [Catellatospora sp. NEAU-YM18]|nr:toll/interleukin-1 receptor domain-containing protein [Catellatospora tritici]